MTYIVRPLDQNDAILLDEFLKPHTAEAYFLRSNAQRAGLDYRGAFLQAEYFGAFKDGAMVGVISFSWLDTILVFAAEEGALPSLARALAPRIKARGGKIEALLGLAPHVEAVIRELAIPPEAFRMDDDDGLFRLSLDVMNVPACAPDMHVRVAQESDKDVLISWRIDFNVEATNAQRGPDLEASVRKEISERLKEQDLYILEKAGQPIGYCGVGGGIADMVMVGPVWTVPQHRGRGYAKCVTAGALQLCAEARKGALKEAVLFASLPAAIRVYESLGFKRTADWRLSLLKADYRLWS